MAGQGRTMAILGGVLAVAIGGVVWLMTSAGGEETSGDAPDAAEPVATAPEPSRETAAPRARKTGTASISGEIRRTAGKAPVAEQEVVLTPERGEKWTATTDADGAFRFEKLPHGGPYELTAAAKGCGTIRLTGIALDRSEQRNVGTLWLDPSVKLTIRVRSGADAPIEGALVEAFAIPQMVDWDWSKALAQIGQVPIAVTHATTDAAGEAVFPEMTVGSWTLTARKTGFATGAARNVRLRTGEEPRPATIYLATGYPLDGRVLAQDRTPVPGVVVMTAAPNSSWDASSAPLRARATTDAEGRFAFAALESGDTQLLVGRGGAVPSPSATIRVPLVPHFDIVLKGSGTLTGVVTLEGSGAPVEGATVRALNWESGGYRAAEAVSDAEGHYTLEMTAGTVNRLTVEKAGFLQVQDASRSGMQRAAMLREGQMSEKNLMLRKAARLAGVVKSAGAPVAGAKVTVASSSPTEGANQKSATSGADGRYEFPAVEKGSVLVLCTKQGYYLPDSPDNWWEAVQSADASKELKIDVPESGDVTKDLELKRGAVVDGVVLGPDGAPLAGVRVSGTGADDPTPTAADGAFHITGVKPGPAVRFWCSKDEYTMATNQPVPVLADQPTTGITLRMVRQAHVRGKVTAESGAALADARVLVAQKTDDQDNPWNEQYRWQNAQRIPVKPDGTYDGAITFGPPGKLLVRAMARDQAHTDAKPVDLVEGCQAYDVDVSLAEGVELSGRVVATTGGAAIEGAAVSLTPHRPSNDMRRYGMNGQYAVWAVTDANGAFRVAHLGRGQYDVRASAEGFVAENVLGETGPGKEVTIELSQELAIEGVVSFADGTPAEGVEVQASQPNKQSRTFGATMEQQTVSTTDAKGAFRVQGLAAGQYGLDVKSPWGSTLNVKAAHLDGIVAGTKDLKIAVEAGGSISGRVVDSNRAPISSAWISANPVPKEGTPMTGNAWRSAQTKPDGTFVLTGLSDQPYQVSVSVNSGTKGYRPAQLPKVEVGTKDLEVMLLEGLSITGIVVDPAGNGLNQVGVQAMPVDASEPGRMGGNAWTDSAGKFTVSGLAPGNYKLDLGQWGGPNAGWVLVEAGAPCAAGTTGVRLVASKGMTISGVVVDEAGKPIANCSVGAMAKGGNSNRWAQSRDDGTFEVTGLDAALTYTVYAQAQGRVNAQSEEVAAGSKDLRIVLAKGLEVSGRLTDAAGKSMASVQIYFQHEDKKHSQSAQTDAEGRFTAGGFVEGAYEAKLYVPKADNTGGDWKTCGTVKAGETGVELRAGQ